MQKDEDFKYTDDQFLQDFGRVIPWVVSDNYPVR
jgi:hypothetical protein